MSKDYINIPKRLHSIENGVNIVTNADEVFDTDQGKKQHEINSAILNQLASIGDGADAFELAQRTAQEKGEEFPYTTIEEWLESLVGKSAFEDWKERNERPNANFGEFLAELKNYNFIKGPKYTDSIPATLTDEDVGTIYYTPTAGNSQAFNIVLV